MHDEKLISRIREADEVETELPFGFTVKDGEAAAEFFNHVGAYLIDKGIHFEKGQQCRIHGFADLVLITSEDGEKLIHIIDYKSDTMNGMSREVFDAQLKKRYRGQMAFYRYALSHLFNIPAEHVFTEIRDLYGGMISIK